MMERESISERYILIILSLMLRYLLNSNHGNGIQAKKKGRSFFQKEKKKARRIISC
jgi:hypothetical protein